MNNGYGLLLGAALLLQAAAAQADDKAADKAGGDKAGGDKAAEATPAAEVDLWIHTAKTGSWGMTLTNKSSAPVRILADARLLWFEVITAPEPLAPGKKPGKAQGFPKGKIPVCRPPAELRPDGEIEKRALILRPGESYDERFDPMLLCGAGKLMQGLKPGAVVYAHYGYPPPTRKSKDPLPQPPYVLDSVSEPRAVLPARGVDAMTMVLSETTEPTSNVEPAKTDKPEPPKGTEPPPVVDERGPRLKLTATPLVDAAGPNDVTISVTLANEGLRAALLRFRSDDVGFTVSAPDGQVTRCDRGINRRAVVRDFFESLRPRGKQSFTLRLQEVCPVNTFARPGVYTVTANASLSQSGEAQNLAATVASVQAEAPTRVRVRSGRLPYQQKAPEITRPPEAPKAPESK